MPKNSDSLASKEDQVSRLKHQLAQARTENNKALALFSSIGEGVIAIDGHGKIERINKVGLNILGYSEKELLNTWFIKTVQAVNQDGSKVSAIDRPISKAFAIGAPVNQKMYYLTKKKIPVPVEVSVSPIIQDGLPTGAIEVFRDLSDEYAKEKIQSEFISIASHQLRTPLSSINTYSQMLIEGYAGKPTKRQAEFLSIIENSAKRMNELIHTLLNVTRVEAGNINVEVSSVNMDKLCSEVIDDLMPMITEKDIRILFKNSVDGPIRTDGILVREVISNLLSNAVKYTKPGGKVVITVTKGSRILLKVKDNGYGIPVRSQDHVFSKFFRASNVVKNDVSGTGLGLYLVRKIASRLDADIWFKSEANKGTTFYFSLPLSGPSKKKGRFTLESR